MKIRRPRSLFFTFIVLLQWICVSHASVQTIKHSSLIAKENRPFSSDVKLIHQEYTISHTLEGIYLLKDKQKPLSLLNLVEVPEGVNVEYTSVDPDIAQVLSNRDIKGVAAGETKLRLRVYKKVQKRVNDQLVEVEEDILTKECPVYVYDLSFEPMDYYGHLYPESALIRLRFRIETPKRKALPGAELTMDADFNGINLTYNNPAIKDITLLKIDPSGEKTPLNECILSKNADIANESILIIFDSFESGIYEVIVSVNITPEGNLTMREYLSYVKAPGGPGTITVNSTFHTLGFNVPLGKDGAGGIPIPVGLSPLIR